MEVRAAPAIQPGSNSGLLGSFPLLFADCKLCTKACMLAKHPTQCAVTDAEMCSAPLLTLMLQDLQALLQSELQLHCQIHNAIWAAVAAMERWSAGVSRGQAKVIHDTNTWLAGNAATAGSYQPVPVPPVVDLSHSLRPPQPEQRQQQQQPLPSTPPWESSVLLCSSLLQSHGRARAWTVLRRALSGWQCRAQLPTALEAAKQAGLA